MRHVFKSLLLAALCLCSIPALAKDMVNFTVDGLQDTPLANVKKSLQVQLESLGKQPTQQQIHYFIDQSPQTIQDALKPYGYFKAKVSSNYTQQNGQASILFHVKPGPQLHWTTVNIKILGAGQSDPRFKRLLAKTPIKPGASFSSEAYENEKQKLYDIANNRGYFAASMKTNKITIDLTKYTADVEIIFDTGPRYTIGSINFNKSPYKNSFLTKYLTFKVGQAYTIHRIENSQQNLTNSGLFTNVTVQPNLAKMKNNQVPIDINITPKKSQEYSFGAGFGTDTGIRGLLGVKLNRVTSTGQQFQALIRASQKSNYVESLYTIPGRNPITDQYQLSATVGTEDQNSGKGNIQKLTASYLTIVHGIQQTLSLSLQRETSEILSNPQFTQFLLVPSVSWLKTIADDPLRPKHGLKLNLTLLGAAKQILAGESFFEAKFYAKTVQQLSKNIRLVARANISTLVTDNIFNVPLSFQLFAGGAQNIRGYAFQSLGPGRYLYVGSVELQHRIYKQFYLGAFIDSGNASTTPFHSFNTGIGLSVVWLSPVGSISVSLAKAMNIPGKPLRVQFSMGPEL